MGNDSGTQQPQEAAPTPEIEIMNHGAIPSSPSPPMSHRPTVEDVEDEGDQPRSSAEATACDGDEWVKIFPPDFDAGGEIEEGETMFEKLQEEQERRGESRWGKFANKDEWELAKWMVKRLTQNKMEELLRLRAVSLVHTPVNLIPHICPHN